MIAGPTSYELYPPCPPLVRMRRYLKEDSKGKPLWKHLVGTDERPRAGPQPLLGAAEDFLLRVVVLAHRQRQPY
jgi:hypothetical protein